jgi:hypothetical protein
MSSSRCQKVYSIAQITQELKFLAKSSAILIMKPILVFPAPAALEIPKSVFLKARLRRTFKKTDFYDENCC